LVVMNIKLVPSVLTVVPKIPLKGVYYIGQYGTSGYATAAKGYLYHYFTNRIPITWEPLYFDNSRLSDDNLYDIVVDGLSGTSGVGADLSRAAHHPEIGNNLVPYNVVNHRHTYEMEQELSLLAGENVTVHFTPVYVPTIRGILDICHTHYINRVTRDEVLSLYRDFYRNEPFIKIYDLPKEENVSWQYRPYPWVSSIAGTNYCFIGLDVDEARQRIVVFSVLDNLGKGGAQAGIENMNVMFGLDRRTGLSSLGLHP
jgi:N-acetyl-gamma-glutamyl-phosphate reductase